MTAYHWRCSCGTHGTVTDPRKTDTANADHKHQQTCTGSVWTGTDEARLARMVDSVKGARTDAT